MCCPDKNNNQYNPYETQLKDSAGIVGTLTSLIVPTLLVVGGYWAGKKNLLKKVFK